VRRICHEEHRLLSKSAGPAGNENDRALLKKDPFTIQNPIPSQLEELIQNLNLFLSEMNELESSSLAGVAQIHPDHRASARNLIDYLALRRHDIRQLQAKLTDLGPSSLGRTEPRVLCSLHAVLNVLHKLAVSDPIALAQEAGPKPGPGNTLLAKNTKALLGEAPTARHVRIMVTMPQEAATNYKLVRDLLAQGMDFMRINCAHDGPGAWMGMIQNLRRAETETNKHCKVAMDLAGPKLRTGSIEPGPMVFNYRPERNTFGCVVSPARIWLTPTSCPEAPSEPADARSASCSTKAPISLRLCASSATFCGACSPTTRRRIRCCENFIWPSFFTLAHDRSKPCHRDGLGSVQLDN
jgi:hypothetical protein